MRNYDRTKKTRKISHSEDGGATWGEIYSDTTLIEPICQAGMLRYSFEEEGISRLLFSNPSDTEKRQNMTLRVSYDDGSTWARSVILFEGPSAYSDMTRLPNGNIGCLYEAGNKNPYQGIVFQVVPLEKLEN